MLYPKTGKLLAQARITGRHGAINDIVKETL
jgi:hypothetical protein